VAAAGHLERITSVTSNSHPENFGHQDPDNQTPVSLPFQRSQVPAEELEMVQPEPMVKRSTACSQGVVGAVDRLSALPNELIHTVLSLLPAPEVVRTCLLSRRWRSLWRSAPRINLDDEDFGISMMTIHDGTLEEKWAKFEDFATNLLLFHDNTSSLGEFRLSSSIYNQRHMDRWIRRGIEYCPSVLKIQIKPRFKFPPIMGSNFCHLKTLHLRSVDFGNHFACLLCPNCPVMEDLELTSCEFSSNSSQRITPSSLKILALVSCVNSTDYPLVITVPSLVNLRLIYGSYKSGISLCKMDSLVKAEIEVAEYETTLPQHSQRELLCNLYNVTSLKLMGFEVEVFSPDKLPLVLIYIPYSSKMPCDHLILHISYHYCWVSYEICQLLFLDESMMSLLHLG